MSLDFQQIHEQVKKMGENAPMREQKHQELRERAFKLLSDNAQEIEQLQHQVEKVVRQYDPTLRCARPVSEPLDAHCATPPLPPQATLLAADGSQITPDRHAAVLYCLINVGAIQMRYGAPDAPTSLIRSELLYDDKLYTGSGTITDSQVSLLRDLSERKVLAELVEGIPGPVITLTDGPIELWGAKDETGAPEFRDSLQAYLASLSKLRDLDVTTAGYVDKPAADLLVRLLEVASTPDLELPSIRLSHPLRGVTDIELYRGVLAPGERSAVFAMQSKSAANYHGDLALRFFYLNVGRPGHPWMARIEIPAWVAESAEKLDNLHAVLVHQCRILGERTYPYLLHRAHEVAVVTLEEKGQVTQMIELELRRRGVPVGERSHKQAAKDLAGRARFGG